MKTTSELTIFLASPSDVEAYRSIVREVVDELNPLLIAEKGIHISVCGWETGTYPTYGTDPQDAVNTQMPPMNECDLFVGILWNRIGSATPRAGSGTIEEFEQATTSFHECGRPHIMVYFGTAPFAPRTSDDAEQKADVLRFKESLTNKALLGEFANEDDFRKKFRQQLQLWLAQGMTRTLSPPRVEGEIAPKGDKSPPPASIDTSNRWLLIGNGAFEAEKVEIVDNNSVEFVIRVGGAEEDAYFSTIRGRSGPNERLLPFAYQNIAGLATVTNAVRTSGTDGDYWTVSLALVDLSSGFGSEMGFNDLTSDDIARMRARFILLNEPPAGLGSGATPSTVGPSNMVLAAMVYGISTPVKVKESILPRLWLEYKDRLDLFLPLARLWSVFHLIASQTVTTVRKLHIGPISDGKLRVVFIGTRPTRDSSGNFSTLEVDGECDLESGENGSTPK